MNKFLLNRFLQTHHFIMIGLVWLACDTSIRANPTGGTVSQGAASFSSLGSQLTINQTSANALINWQSFNISAGETTTFIQPSASSVAWNQINDVNPSQILGNLNANGYVVLQNQNGFAIGGSAVINAHGLVMTTAPTPALDFSSGGAWSFNAPPPTAKIVNYGQINITGGGSVFLIASDIENKSSGSISAPGGKIGLYAGQQVLVSTSPDGRGLSAQVTLPKGSVDNEGKLIADAGSIVAQAQIVNQNGLIQANSVQNINGTIELVAGEAVNLGASSKISAQGDSQGNSSAGSVTIKSDSSFSDQAGSTINIAGGAQGGNGGQVEISGRQMDAIQSAINAGAVFGYSGGRLTIDPTDINLDSAYIANVNSLIGGGLSVVNLMADNNITVSSAWTLADASASASVNLTAGNNIILNNGSGIQAGNNWTVNLTAGTQLAFGSTPASGHDGIYLNGTAYIRTQNGDINLLAPNEVQVGWLGSETKGVANKGLGSITTTAGGNINIMATYGNVNTGANDNGYIFKNSVLEPYYVSSTLGGISTAAGGNVTITAGGDVTSFLPTSGSLNDAGSGAFGSQLGNVTVRAGGSVYGHYVEANGIGSITAQTGNVGSIAVQNDGSANSTFALSLITGNWDVEAPNGSIYLQEVRNPNGVLNNKSGKSLHVFDYNPDASLKLDAGDAVAITGGSGLPRTGDAKGLPIVLPPTLEVTAGAGGFTLYQNITLFQSPDGNVNITTLNGGDFTGIPIGGINPQFFMSDSSDPKWSSSKNPFILANSVHADSPPELNNPNPVVINISGSLNNVDIYTTKATQITVDQDMKNSSFVGENLHPGDVSFIKVTGKIYYSPFYAFENLSQPIATIPYGSDNPITQSQWDTIFYLLVDPTVAASVVIPSTATTADLKNYYLNLKSWATVSGNLWLFPPSDSASASGSNPGFVYNSTTLRLGYGGKMAETVKNELDGTLYGTTIIKGITYGTLNVIRLAANGTPVIQNGHLVLDTVTFVDKSTLDALYTASQGSSTASAPGMQIGGPGQFQITAGSMDLGNSQGIESWGIAGPVFSSSPGNNFNSLAGETPSGAAVDVTVTGDLDMLTSRIASMYGGKVTVTVKAGGIIDLGSQEVKEQALANAFGIYSTGNSDVNVTADGNININGSRIAAFNGGNIFIKSLTGSVNVGDGANSYVTVPLVSSTLLPGFEEIGSHNYYLGYQIFGSGIVTTSLPQNLQSTGEAPLPGNIIVETPYGNISGGQAGILQYALNGSTAGGPTITLTAGTPGVTATPDLGNINFGGSAIIGGTVNLQTFGGGNIDAQVIARQNSSINTAGNFSGTLLAAGTADISAGGSISGIIIGVTGISASGASMDATLLSQNVSAPGQSGSTLGSSASATSTSQSAAATSSNEATQQASSNGNDNQDDEKKKKKAPLMQRISRVTVLLSAATPPR